MPNADKFVRRRKEAFFAGVAVGRSLFPSPRSRPFYLYVRSRPAGRCRRRRRATYCKNADGVEKREEEGNEEK